MPGIVPEHVLQQIRHANDIVEVIGSYFPLKRAGANFRALCPFHKEKTPSFNVNPTKQIFHCFGCGAGGDVFGFVMKYENLDFPGAVRRLADRGGVRLEFEEAAGGPTRDEKESLLKLHEEAAGWFHANLMKEKSAEIARGYLTKRKISAETAKRWQIGYAPDSWDAMLTWARAKKYPATLLETAGLVARSERDGSESRVYDRFRGRLMFPIRDEQGRVVAFSGRILTDAKEAKYVNSPETPIFQKGRVLFALDKAKREIIEQKVAILCEGQIDTISCHEAGITNVAAPQGTAFTEQHARILKRYADEVVLMFDSDAAGQGAAVRNAEPLWDMGFVIRVALLPSPHDPDSFIQEFGAEKLRELIAAAEPFFDFLLGRLSREHDPRSERGKVQIAGQMVEWLCRIRDPILQATYAQRTASRLDVREEALRQSMRNRSRGSRAPAPAAEAGPAPVAGTRPRGLPDELALLQLMLADERVVELVSDRLDLVWLSEGTAGETIRRVLKLYRSHQWTGATQLLAGSGSDEAAQLVTELLMSPAYQGELMPLAERSLTALERHWLQRQLREIPKRLGQKGLPVTEIVRLQQQVLDLKRKLDHIPALSMSENKRAAP